MSTKIYNGYRIKNIHSLSDLYDFIHRLRTILVGKFNELNADDFYKNVIFAYDKLVCGQLKDVEDWNQSLYFHSTEITDSMRKEFDNIPYLNISFISLPDKVLALYYGSYSEIQKLWESLEEVEPYWYWNNTDPDEDCSEEEWNQRELDWDIALGYDAPCKVSLNYDPINHMNLSHIHCYERTNIIASEIYDMRLKYCLSNLLYAYYIETYPSADPNKSAYSIYNDYRDWKKTDEGISATRYYTKKIKWRLPRDIKSALFSSCSTLFVQLPRYRNGV